MDVLFYLTSILFLNNVCSANKYHWSLFRSSLYSGIVRCDHRKDQNRSVSELLVHFYDFQNNTSFGVPIDPGLESITAAYNLDVKRNIVFYVPGYKFHMNKETVELIREVFRDVPNIYLIILDHSAYTAAKYGIMKSYARAVSYAYYIGKAVGQFLAGFKQFGYPSKNIHCIGHSLGSQILGYTGIEYFNRTSEKIGKITGIDPAGPCFSNALIEEQIRSGVAEYVEVYHCNAGGLGTTAVLADVDYFLNKEGKTQPHCGGGFNSLIPAYGEYKASKCSHRACIKYWAQSVRHPSWYVAWACDSYEDFHGGKCAGNETTIAGYWGPGNATGIFYVSTELHGAD